MNKKCEKILKELETEGKLKVWWDFKFPEKEELKLRLKDMLEDEVDEKYYLDNAKIEKIINSNFMQERKRIQYKEYSDTILARDWKDPKCVQVGNLQGGKWDKINESCRRVYGEEGISPTIHTCQGGNTEPKILINNTTKNDSMRVVEDINKNAKHQQDLIQHKNDVCRVIPAGTHGSTPHLLKTIVNDSPLRIRKLTPKECWRLMGFSDEDFEKAQNVPMSNTQLYKQARKFNRG